MKVKDLISQLSKLDQSLEIYGYSEDDSIAIHDKPFRFFFIDDVSLNDATLSRGHDGSPEANFDGGPDSQRLVLINMRADF